MLMSPPPPNTNLHSQTTKNLGLAIKTPLHSVRDNNEEETFLIFHIHYELPK